MSELPELNEDDIARWTDVNSFARGERYFAEGRIFMPQRMGGTLKALCHGSQPEPYRVEITLGAGGIAYGSCSCPVGMGGRCKHTVALLLTWLDDPDSFVETMPAEVALETLTKKELVALLRRMMALHPELEAFLESAAADGAPSAAGAAAAVVAFVRSQFHRILGSTGSAWDAVYDMVRDLDRLIVLGDQYVQQGAWQSAVSFFQVLLEEILAHYREVRDEESELAATASLCAERLAACLPSVTDHAARQEIWRALFDACVWDVSMGVVGVGEALTEAVATQPTPEERCLLVGWAEKRFADLRPDDEYARQDYGRLLLALQADTLDDEAFLRLCREAGLIEMQVDRLLTLGRVDEAVAAIRRCDPHTMLRMASLLRDNGYAADAVRVVHQRLQAGGRDLGLMNWLKEEAIRGAEWSEALSWAERLFRESPSAQGYAEIKMMAQEVGDWEARRLLLWRRLEVGNRFEVLTRIYLQEGMIDEALVALEMAREGRYGGMLPLTLAEEVAAKAEDEHPQRALRLYLEIAQALIGQRNRGSYADASQALLRAKALYMQQGEEETWQHVIGTIRDQNKRLRALKEEMARAGL